MTGDVVYTAISFAPVQGFIEKSRKLRDLFGASLILSYLSTKLVDRAETLDFEVISPSSLDIKEGMPNRILIKGSKPLNRDEVKNTLIAEWGIILDLCRNWIEKQLAGESFYWSQLETDKGIQKGEWERWKSYTWEVFWGYGATVKLAMEDLETRKLKRDWIGVNWTGESSSLSGTDAIAWPRLGQESSRPWEWQDKKEAVTNFYSQLANVLEPSSKLSSGNTPSGKFLAPNERLSILELVKRLVTRYEDIGRFLDKDFRFDSLSEMVRLPQADQPGHWTGWFMGDGDNVGDKLKELAESPHDVQPLKQFSDAMRQWGNDFNHDFPDQLGRVIYAGGDDFLGVIYSKDPYRPIPEYKVLLWLMGLNQQWQSHGQPITLSVGFVWAGHSVPQRDVLQHCRDAEKRAKTLGKDRVTIRILFNSGQYVQWTCPWDYLDVLTKYRDRDGKTGLQANWSHLYSDWATLKARHAIRLSNFSEEHDDRIALKIFELYFDDMERFEQHSQEIFKDDYTPKAVIEWLDSLVNVGWQLCSNT
jgi:CRISPR-associated protein Cmr2